MNSNFDQLREIFLGALEQATPGQREAFLDQACGGDAELRRNVAKLLLAHAQGGDAFAHSILRGAATAAVPPITEKPGVAIGPYKLMEQIGEGGMGLVFVAEQQLPVRRKVALKVIKPGMDTREVIARFEAERQALALMDHPNIARVLDAGETQSGRPYFVMELVKGVPITQFCDENRLTPRQRLELFAHVCQAVQHAHQKGIIHRDLKPSNVLVVSHDGTPVVKVIDFGVAKAIGQQLTERTVYTALTQMVGTPLYMSPEQAGMSGLDIDTRSDIYSLGVLLYELLTGTTPFDKERLKQAAFDEIRRIIREEEPPKPSTRISTTAAAPSIAAQRHTEPAKLARLVRGELDWIVMKALEKDRNRRYETANGLAMDVQRFLNDEHVLACPPSASYRLRKLVRRNKAALATTALVMAALVLGFAVSAWQAVRATRAEALAERRWRAETQARKDAERARDGEKKQRKLAVQQHALAQQNAAEAEAQRRRAEANFAQARKAVDDYFVQISESELLQVPGMQTLRQELLRSALEFYQEFVNLRGDDPRLKEDLAMTYVKVARIHRELEARADAAQASTEALKLFRELLQDDPDRLELKAGETACLQFQANYPEAIQGWENLLRLDPANNHYRHELARAYNSLAVGQFRGNQVSEALASHQKARDLCLVLVALEPKNPGYLHALGQTLNNIGAILSNQGRREDALALFHESAGYSETARSQAPAILEYGSLLITALGNIGLCECVLGRNAEALAAYQQRAEVSRSLALRNPAAPSLQKLMFDAFRSLAVLQRRLNQPQDAARSLRQAREVMERLPRETAGDWYVYASVKALCASPPPDDEIDFPEDPRDQEAREQDADEAITALRTAIEKGCNAIRLDRDANFDALRNRDDYRALAEQMTQMSRLEEIDQERNSAAKVKVATDIAEALAKLSAADPQNALLLASYAHSRYSLGLARSGLGELDEAFRSLDEARESQEKLVEQNPQKGAFVIDLGHTWYALGHANWKAQRYAAARENWNKGFEILDRGRRSLPDDVQLRRALAIKEGELTEFYSQLGHWPLAARHWSISRAADRYLSVIAEARFTMLDLRCDERGSYPQQCRYLAERFAEADPTAVAWASSLSPHSSIEPDRILELAEQGLASQPTIPFAATVVALAHYCRGEFALAQIPDWSQYSFLRATLAFRLARHEEAHRLLESAEREYAEQSKSQLCESMPAAPAWWQTLWWELVGLQRNREEAWNVVEGKTCVDPWQHLREGRLWAKLGERQEAERSFQAAIGAAPDEVQVRLIRAHVYAQLGEHEKALADWAEALARDPNNLELWISRGRYFAERGEHEKAEADFAQAALLTPRSSAVEVYRAENVVDNIYAWFLLAMAHSRRGDKDLACRTFAQAVASLEKNQEAIETNKHHAERLRSLRVEAEERLGADVVRAALERSTSVLDQARQHAAARQWSKAAPLYQEALEWRPSDDAVWFERSAVLLLNGDAEAFRQTRAAFLKRPAPKQFGPPSYFRVRLPSLAPLETKEAEEAAQSAVKQLSPKFAMLNANNAGLALYRAGRFEEAIENFHVSLDNSGTLPGRVMNWPMLALAHQALGQADEANKWLDQAVGFARQNPDGKVMHIHHWLAFHVLLREAKQVVTTNDQP